MTDEQLAGDRLTIVMPVYNDWASFQCLIRDLGSALAGLDRRVDVLAMDDCSTDRAPESIASPAPIARVRVLRLAANVGHQRAIAIGLMHVAEEREAALVAVMDSDGEDRPVELRRMIDQATAAPGVAIVAQRMKRSESALFQFFYWLYLRLFNLLTGHRIRFGNFSLLPMWQVRRIVNSPHIWNNFAAALVQSRMPILYVPTARGVRYAGRSTMNFVSLIAHGLGAISVFSEAVFIRILLASTALFGSAIAVALVALALRLFSAVAIPGWATNVIGFALLISLQALITPITVAFLLLSNRAAVQPLPKSIAPSFIESERVLGRGPSDAIAGARSVTV